MLSVGVPHAALAINSLTKELEQPEADERAARLSGAVKEEEQYRRVFIHFEAKCYALNAITI
jgi:hypothetical protein